MFGLYFGVVVLPVLLSLLHDFALARNPHSAESNKRQVKNENDDFGGEPTNKQTTGFSDLGLDLGDTAAGQDQSIVFNSVVSRPIRMQSTEI